MSFSERRCGTKVSYRLFHVAAGVASALTVKEGQLLEPYKCPDCGQWHVGHAGPSEQMSFQKQAKIPCRACGGKMPLERVILGAQTCSKACRTAWDARYRPKV